MQIITVTVKLDAAVKVPDSDTSLFFVGQKILVYSHSKKAQVDSRNLPGLVENIDAAYVVPNTTIVRIVKGCETWDMDAVNLTLLVTQRTQLSSCEQIDDAIVWQSELYTFKDCHVTPQRMEPINLTDWGLPCQIDAALNNRGHIVIFKGNEYWKYTGQGQAVLEGKTLDWTIDAVRCRH